MIQSGVEQARLRIAASGIQTVMMNLPVFAVHPAALHASILYSYVNDPGALNMAEVILLPTSPIFVFHVHGSAC